MTPHALPLGKPEATNPAGEIWRGFLFAWASSRDRIIGMEDIVEALVGVMIACDFIWRVVRVVNGEPLTTVLRTNTRNEFIAGIIGMAVITCLMAFLDGNIATKATCAIFSGGATVVLVLELIYGEKDEPPDKRKKPRSAAD
jgi:hypothetical protein